MTTEDRLKYANFILSSDAAFESDCVISDEMQKRPVTRREVLMAHVISDLYKLIHHAVGNCTHWDWEEENERKYNEIKDKI